MTILFRIGSDRTKALVRNFTIIIYKKPTQTRLLCLTIGQQGAEVRIGAILNQKYAALAVALAESVDGQYRAVSTLGYV